MSIVTRCRGCGVEFEADRIAIVAGSWRLCAACRAEEERRDRRRPAAIPCQGCGRPLRDPKRPVCARCLGVTG